MGWTLVVSQDENFQREAIARSGSYGQIVGATGEASACTLARALDVEQILVDALDDVGRQFLSILGQLPAQRFSNVVVVDPTGRSPRYRTARNIAGAFPAPATT